MGFRQIASLLIAEIQQGNWGLDELFPSEIELVERFRVGRNTVREALRELQSLGYIRRRRGARSVLAAISPQVSFVNSVHSVSELLDYAKSARATVLTTETIRIDERLARRIDCPVNTEWLRIGILRSRDAQGPAFCYSEVYIDPAYADVVERLENESEIYALLERMHGIVIRRIEQEIEAVLADANIASRLNVPMGSAILMVKTRFHSSDGRLVELGIAHFPAGRYKVKIALDRRAPEGGA